MRTIEEIQSDIQAGELRIAALGSQMQQLNEERNRLADTLVGLRKELEAAQAAQGILYKTILYTPLKGSQANPGQGISYNLDVMWPANPANARVGMIGHYVFEFPKVYENGKRVFNRSGITEEWIAKAERGLAWVESLGKLLRCRFTYNNPRVGENPRGEDAELKVMLEDIHKIGPRILRRFGHLLILEKGFAGDWGEELSSVDGAHLPEGQWQTHMAIRQYFDGPILYRRPDTLQALGFSSAAEARAANCFHHNDSFGAQWDGTFTVNYNPPPKPSPAEQRAWVGGIGVEIEIMEDRTPTAMTGVQLLAEIARYGAMIYNGESPGRNQLPARGVTLDRLEANLGYKFVAEGCRLPDQVQSNTAFDVQIWGQNTGNAQPIRPYKLSLCLWPVGVNTTPMFFSLDGNPQYWGAKQPWRVEGKVKVPVPGLYYTFLAIDDAQIPDDHRYRIALDNEWSWGPMAKANSRLNDLGHQLKVV